jgi:protein-tyrosine phosphatase
MTNILVVCTANICRSPVVAALLSVRLQERGFVDWRVYSAGTWAILTRGASRYSVQLMAGQGIDITAHRARMVDEAMLREADLILCMELGHVEALQVEFPDYRDKIYALSEMVGKSYSIEDPYGGSLSDYESMVRQVTELIDGGLDTIIQLAESRAGGG